MLTKNLPRPVRRQWNDRVMLTPAGVKTAEVLNTNLCPDCGSQYVHTYGVCDCRNEDDVDADTLLDYALHYGEEYEPNPYDGTYSEC